MYVVILLKFVALILMSMKLFKYHFGLLCAWRCISLLNFRDYYVISLEMTFSNRSPCPRVSESVSRKQIRHFISPSIGNVSDDN